MDQPKTASGKPAMAATGVRKTTIDLLRSELRLRNLSPRTEVAYVSWVRRFRAFAGARPFAELGPNEVRQFLDHLVRKLKVSASTQNQATAALLFLFGKVLHRPLSERLQPDQPELLRPKLPERVPTVLTANEARTVLEHMNGVPRIVASLLYGAGLRLLEGLRLRVKDVDFDGRQVVVRDGKGRKDRISVLPERLIPDLTRHLQVMHEQHLADRAAGAGYVELTDALNRKVRVHSSPWPSR
ncbi:MAG: phage integrase N-terminal SAM-like domain-containing protein, partial [Candidatus Wallbacteria bacterium]|nr:phage integrase N-terminal SAM-like domain-containing protein [Candidatus Wallbacteria bacterium]